MFWGDFGNKVLTATWTRLSFHSHFQFLLTTLTGITIQTEEEEQQQAGAGEGLGYEATSDKAAQEGRAQKNKTFNQTSGESLVLFPTPATLFSFPFQLPFSGGKGKQPAWGGGPGLPPLLRQPQPLNRRIF